MQQSILAVVLGARDDPGLSLVPLRVAVRHRRHGHDAARHRAGDRALRLLQIEFDLTSIAAILTIMGYSLNDTVVIYDRIREMLRKYKRMPIGELLDTSINATVSRTIIVAATTFFATARALPLRRRGAARLQPRHAVRRRRRHLLDDLHRRADPDLSRRARPPRTSPSADEAPSAGKPAARRLRRDA